MAVAIALSLALHEMLAGFVPGTPPAKTRAERVEIARVEIRHAPRPKPAPALHRPRIRIVAHALAIPRRRHVRRNVRRPQATRPTAGRPRPSAPEAIAAATAAPLAATGAGAVQTAGAGSATAGTGNGDAGNGSSGAGGGCGYVEFVNPPGPPVFDPATGFYVYTGIRMIVHRSDGTSDSVVLDYPWRYRDESGDPFQHPDAPMLFEFPPGSMRATEPPLVQYVMSHSSPIGTTDLNDCAATSPEPKGSPSIAWYH